MTTVVTAMANMISQINLLVGLQGNQCTSIYPRIGESNNIIIMYLIVLIATSCKRLMVQHADLADCNGEYALSNTSVSWAPSKPVYWHVSKDR